MMIGGRSAEDGGRWERYLEAERIVTEERGQGWLARALGEPLRGESPEELGLMAREDRRRAEEGLVELLEDGELSCKQLEELAPRDLPARIEAEDARTSWLVERAKQRAAEQLEDARNGWAPRGRAIVGVRTVKGPAREGDGYRRAACGYKPSAIDAPLAPDIHPGDAAAGAGMEKVEHGSPVVVRGGGEPERLECALRRAHKRNRSRPSGRLDVMGDGVEFEMPPAPREDDAQ